MMSSDESDIILTEADGLHWDDTYKVTQVFTRCCGGPMYLRQRICELTKVLNPSAETDEVATSKDKKNAAKPSKVVIKSSRSGTVREIFVKKDQIVTIGSRVVRVSVCRHPTMLGNTCCDCGVTIEEEDEEEGADAAREGSRRSNLHQPPQETVAMLHSMPGLKVSMEEAKRLGFEDKQHLLDNNKLVLLVDLDQTILHTTNDEPPPNAEDLFHFRLHHMGPVYHTRLRPYTRQFLKAASRLYQLHICTFGVREYAHAIAKHLDPNGELFGDRILSRNECLDPMSKKANLKSLFPCGDELVCIIDDRSDVWNYSPNVVQVLPYLFFEQTGDINAPPTAEAHGSESIVNNARRKHHSKMGRSQHGGDTKQPSAEATVQQQQRKMMLQQQAAFNSDKSSCSPEQRERLQKIVSSSQASDSNSNSSSTAYSDADDVTVNGEGGAAISKSDKDTKTKDQDCDKTQMKSEGEVQTELGDTKSDEAAKEDAAKEDASGEGDKVLVKDESTEKTGDDAMETDQAKDGAIDQSTKMEEEKPSVENVNKDASSQDSCEQKSEGPEPAEGSETLITKESSVDVKISDDDSAVKGETAEKTPNENEDEPMTDAKLSNDDSSAILEAGKTEVSEESENQKDVISKRDETLHNGTMLEEAPSEADNKIMDHDDYLLHLEDILKRIHKEFYSLYKPTKTADGKKSGSDKNKLYKRGLCKLPDLKEIVPELRTEVLKGCNILFSGVVPRRIEVAHSKAYSIATSLGARVCDDLIMPEGGQQASTTKEATSLFGQSYFPTTHVVAANRHTVKVKQARATRAAAKAIRVVTPDWLWTCWERWERVDERLYPLNVETEATLRRSPSHHYCLPPPGTVMFRQQSVDLFLMKETAKKSMMEEVEEDLDSEDSDGGKGTKDKAGGTKRPLEAADSDSSQTSSSGNDDVEGDSESNSKDATFKTTRQSQPEKKRKKLMRKKRKKKLDRQFVRNPSRSDGVCGGDEDTDDDDSSGMDELPSVRFRRGGALESGAEESSSAASDVEALDSGEEERLLRLEQDLMES